MHQDLHSVGLNTPWTWLAASLYIDEENYLTPILSENQRKAGKEAVGYYAAAYAIEILGEQKLAELFNNSFLVRGDGSSVSFKNDLIPEFFESNVVELAQDAFNQEMQIHPDDTRHFTTLFDCLKKISYTKEAKQIIYSKILKDEFTDEEIAYFLCSNRDICDYVERFQILKHIILDRVSDGSRNNFFAMEMACQEMGRIYNAIYRNGTLRQWFQKELLDKLNKSSRAFEIIAIDEKEIEKDDERSLKDFVTKLLNEHIPYFSQARINEIANNIDGVFKIVGEIIFNNTQHKSLSTVDKGILVSKVNDLFLMLCDGVETIGEAKALSILLNAIKDYAESFYENDKGDGGYIIWYRIDNGLKYAQRRAKAIERERTNLLTYANDKNLKFTPD